MKIKVILICVLFIPMLKVSFGQTLDTSIKLKLKGTCTISNKDYTGLAINLINERQTIKIGKNEFNFALDYDQIYLLEFKKENYGTKYVNISTKNVSVKRWNKGIIPIYFKVELVLLNSDSIIIKPDESPLIYYDKKIGDFNYLLPK